MEHYTYYLEQTGCIVGSGTTPSAGAVVLPEGCALHLGAQLSNKEFYFSGGQPVAYSEFERALLAHRPPHAARWDIAARQWVDLRDLAQMRDAKRAQINRAWEQANMSGFLFLGKLIGTDALDRSNIDAINGSVALMQVMPADWVGGWKTVDNDYVPIASVNEWKAFYGAMVAQGQANFAKAQALKAQIVTASASELTAITWVING